MVQSAPALGCRGTLPVIVSAIILSACATASQPTPIVSPDLEAYVRAIGRQILAVTEDADRAEEYRLVLADLNKAGFAGLSLGGRVIYIDFTLAHDSRTAAPEGIPPHLAMVIAHEIAHDTAGHVAKQKVLQGVFQSAQLAGQAGAVASYVPGPIGWAGAAFSWLMWGVAKAGAPEKIADLYGRDQELEADRKAIGYWKALGWNCDVWVTRFQQLADKGITGDFRHPTEGRLAQAKELCRDNPDGRSQ